MDRGQQKRWRETRPSVRAFLPFGPQPESFYLPAAKSSPEITGYGTETQLIFPAKSAARERRKAWWRYEGHPWSTYGDPVGETFDCRCGRRFWLPEGELVERLAEADARGEDALLTVAHPVPHGLSDVIPFDPRIDTEWLRTLRDRMPPQYQSLLVAAITAATVLPRD